MFIGICQLFVGKLWYPWFCRRALRDQNKEGNACAQTKQMQMLQPDAQAESFLA